MHVFAGALLIFVLRIGDVSFGTLRVMFMVRGRRSLAAVMAVGEASVYLLAIARVLKGDLNVPMVVGYACGYAAGTVVGITLESWIGIGSVLMRVISQTKGGELRDVLLADGFGVTTIQGEGKDGSVLILFVVARRRRSKALLTAVRRIDAGAFITVEPVGHAFGGHQPVFPTPTGVIK